MFLMHLCLVWSLCIKHFCCLVWSLYHTSLSCVISLYRTFLFSVIFCITYLCLVWSLHQGEFFFSIIFVHQASLSCVIFVWHIFPFYDFCIMHVNIFCNLWIMHLSLLWSCIFFVSCIFVFCDLCFMHLSRFGDLFIMHLFPSVFFIYSCTTIHDEYKVLSFISIVAWNLISTESWSSLCILHTSS